MSKFAKRMSALILAATMIASTAFSGYAAQSPDKGNTNTKTEEKTEDNKTNTNTNTNQNTNTNTNTNQNTNTNTNQNTNTNTNPAKEDPGKTILTTKKTSKKKEVALTNAKTTKDSMKNLFVKGWINKKYVNKISTGAVNDKTYDKITFELWNRTKVKKNVLKGKAKKTKTVVITKTKKAHKLVAKRFNKKAFKGYKGKIIVKKFAMSKKQFKKLKKRLKKGGFKGKIVYKK